MGINNGRSPLARAEPRPKGQTRAEPRPNARAGAEPQPSNEGLLSSPERILSEVSDYGFQQCWVQIQHKRNWERSFCVWSTDLQAAHWIVDCTESLSFLLITERKRARCTTARDTGVNKVSLAPISQLLWTRKERELNRLADDVMDNYIDALTLGKGMFMGWWPELWNVEKLSGGQRSLVISAPWIWRSS